MTVEYTTKDGTAAQEITADEFASHLSDVKRVDLACGKAKKAGYIGVDELLPGTFPYPEAEYIQHDLSVFPWPFEDNSIYEIHCSHYVEHVSNLIRFMEEAHRILMPMGLITIAAPYQHSDRAWQDPTHVRAINQVTFNYFSQPWLKAANIDHYNVQADFDVMSTVMKFGKEWEPRADDAKVWAAKHYVNVVDDIVVTLRAVKPIRS
jgi:predicted SAM-dependent methyltransferase